MGVEIVDVRALGDRELTADRAVLWSTENQLQANLVRLAPGVRIDVHAENVLDVVVVFPAGTRRDLTAGPQGATYLTTHRRRDGFMPTLR